MHKNTKTLGASSSPSSSSGGHSRVAAALARCDREIAEIDARDPHAAADAYLSVLGREDWNHEKRIIERNDHTASRPAGAEMPELAESPEVDLSLSAKFYRFLQSNIPPEITVPELLFSWSANKKPANLRNRMMLASNTRGIRAYVLRHERSATRRRRLLMQVRIEHREMAAEYTRAEAIVLPLLEQAKTMQQQTTGGVN